MATSIDFGSLSSSGSTPRLSGTSSRIDTESLIEALSEAKRLPALRLENQITRNEAKLAAFSDLRGLLSELKSSVSSLRNPPGVLGVKDNIFEAKGAFFSSSSLVPPNELIGVSTSNQAKAGSFEVKVEQLAAARKFASAAATSADQTLADAFNAGAGFSGTITLGLDGSGTNATIAVDGAMDIYDLSAAINAKTQDTGVRTSVLKVGEADFRLIATAVETGKEVGLGGDSATLNLLGLSADGGATFANSIHAPQSALLEIDGIAVTRSSNQIADAVEGLTFNLFKADSGTTIKIDVEPALSEVKSAVTRFVDAYNAVRGFIDQQSALGEAGSIDEGAVLFGNSTLRSLDRTLAGIVSGRVAGLDAGALTSLGSVGISLDSSNKLSVDEAKLDGLLLEDLDAVRDVLEFRFTSDSTDLSVFARGNTLGDSDFALVITDSDNDGIIESATIDGIAMEVDGRFLKGPVGSAYEGLELFWSGTGSTTINAQATTGLAERIFIDLDKALDEVDGSLTVAADNLETLNDRHGEDIVRMEERVESFRTRLIEKFSALETALSLAEAMLDQIRATTDAMTGDNR